MLNYRQEIGRFHQNPVGIAEKIQGLISKTSPRLSREQLAQTVPAVAGYWEKLRKSGQIRALLFAGDPSLMTGFYLTTIREPLIENESGDSTRVSAAIFEAMQTLQIRATLAEVIIINDLLPSDPSFDGSFRSLKNSSVLQRLYGPETKYVGSLWARRRKRI